MLILCTSSFPAESVTSMSSDGVLSSSDRARLSSARSSRPFSFLVSLCTTTVTSRRSTSSIMERPTTSSVVNRWPHPRLGSDTVATTSVRTSISTCRSRSPSSDAKTTGTRSITSIRLPRTDGSSSISTTSEASTPPSKTVSTLSRKETGLRSSNFPVQTRPRPSSDFGRRSEDPSTLSRRMPTTITPTSSSSSTPTRTLPRRTTTLATVIHGSRHPSRAPRPSRTSFTLFVLAVGPAQHYQETIC